MALIKKYEVELDVKYYSTGDIEDVTEEQAVDMAITEFYDESHRAEIDGWEVNSSLYCDECGDEDVEEDHVCEEDKEDN